MKLTQMKEVYLIGLREKHGGSSITKSEKKD